MRILMLATRCLPDVGGVERHVDAVASGLRDKGHVVKVFALGGIGDFWKRVPLLILIMLQERFNVIHAHDFLPTIIAYFVRLIVQPKASFFCTIHGYEGFPLRRHFIYSHLLAQAMVKKTISVGGYIDKWYGTKSDLVIHGGVASAQIAPLPRKLRGVFMGRLTRDTDALEVARAFKLAACKLPQAAFCMYGFGDMVEEIGMMIQGQQNLTLGGLCSEPEEVFETASVVVANSYLAILEALSCGRPVISIYGNPLKADYLREIASGCRAVTVCDSAEDLAAALVALLNKQHAREAMAEEAVVYARRHTWNAVVDDYEAIWNGGTRPMPSTPRNPVVLDGENSWRLQILS